MKPGDRWSPSPSSASWRRTIFYPFLHATRFVGGAALDVRVQASRYGDPQLDAAPLVDAIATLPTLSWNAIRLARAST